MQILCYIPILLSLSSFLVSSLVSDLDEHYSFFIVCHFDAQSNIYLPGAIQPKRNGEMYFMVNFLPRCDI